MNKLKILNKNLSGINKTNRSIIMIVFLTLSIIGQENGSLAGLEPAFASEKKNNTVNKKELEGFKKQVREEKIAERLNLTRNVGYAPPYIPVIQPPEVKKVWIPTHKSTSDKDVLISGHWIYLKIKDDAWFTDLEREESSNLTIIIPTEPAQQ